MLSLLLSSEVYDCVQQVYAVASILGAELQTMFQSRIGSDTLVGTLMKKIRPL